MNKMLSQTEKTYDALITELELMSDIVNNVTGMTPWLSLPHKEESKTIKLFYKELSYREQAYLHRVLKPSSEDSPSNKAPYHEV